MPVSNDRKDMVVLGAAVGLTGIGLYLALRKPPAIRPGDRVTLSAISFEFMGPAGQLYVCWGLKRQVIVDFDNGAGLLAGLWAAGGAINVEAATTWTKYSVDPSKLATKPVLYLDPVFVVPAVYTTFVWVSSGIATTDEASILVVDTDADAIEVKE